MSECLHPVSLTELDSNQPVSSHSICLAISVEVKAVQAERLDGKANFNINKLTKINFN